MSTYSMPKEGDVLAGKYRLENAVGEGGMGIVYAAEHLVLHKRVAVKVLLPEAATSEAVVERFAREAQAAACIQSEHVARVMDAGSTATGAPFLVMEYLEGCDLEELLALQGVLPPTDVVDYLLQALEALAHAHAVGLVHRDLKPANLFLACRVDGGNAIKVLDFGISKSTKASRQEKVLTGQAVLGSPVYMSPEQLRNARELDGRADLWSLGVVAYELMTGKPPFDGEGVGEIFAAILEKDPAPLHTAAPGVSPGLSAVIAKCLSRKAEDRYADAAELARALAPFGSGTVGPVVERAEQVLVRAKRLSVAETPASARLVVEAIAAAAERARITGVASRSGRPVVASEEGGGPSTTLPSSRAPRSRARPFAIGAVVVLLATGAAFAAGLAVQAARPAMPQVVLEPMEMAANGAAPRGEAQGDEGASLEAHGDEEAPLVMDLPETPATHVPAPRARKTKSSRPHRPKFLGTRE